MRELYVFCEGPTEQGFCNQVLAPHLFPHSDGSVHTIRVAHSKSHGLTHRGGVGRYASLSRDIKNTLKSRHEGNVSFTSLIDLYGLPSEFPGKSTQVQDRKNPGAYAVALESAFGADINDHRFIPHLQLHEYETMLFSEPEAFKVAFDDGGNAIESLKMVVAEVASIEEIDDGYETCPSRRIIRVFPGYEGRKASAGPDIAEWIGVSAIRARCPHFDQWLRRLEGLSW
jgi:hypothetical protein